MQVVSSISGNQAVIEAMKKLPRGVRNRAVRPALRAGAQVVKKQASSNIKGVVSERATGLLERSVVVRTLRQKGQTLRVAIALARGVSRKGVRIGLYGSVLEHGKENQIPRPYLRPAIQQTRAQVQSVVAQEARKRLEAAVEDAKR